MRAWVAATLGLSCVIGAGLAAADDARRADPRGAQLFERYCVRCHRAGATALEATPAQTAAILRGRSVPAHRFELDPTAIEALTAYLESSAEANDESEPQP